MRRSPDCQRCGLCCKDIGTFWAHSKNELIDAFAKILSERAPVAFRDTGDCDFLRFEPSGRAVCLVRKWLGSRGLPAACKQYPQVNNEPCEREKAERESEVE